MSFHYQSVIKSSNKQTNTQTNTQTNERERVCARVINLPGRMTFLILYITQNKCRVVLKIVASQGKRKRTKKKIQDPKQKILVDFSRVEDFSSELKRPTQHNT